MSSTNPAQLLYELLNKTTSNSGTFIRYEAGSALVSTASGVGLYPITLASSLTSGDKVAIQGGVVTNKLKSDSELPRYIV